MRPPGRRAYFHGCKRFTHRVRRAPVTQTGRGASPPRLRKRGAGRQPTGHQPPQLGSNLLLGMDDTTGLGGLVSGGSHPFVFISTAGSSACGIPLPGFGPGGQTGELLIDLGQLALTAPLGVGPWTGPGTPSTISLPLADKPAFAGLSFFAQGLWVTPNPVLNLLLSNGLQLTLGY